MRAYVIDSKEQDISYIPIDSFVYHDGCGFIKRKQTTAVWNDTDFERIYCTSNSELNPTIQRPEDGVLLKDACCLRFVVSGAYDFEKGATITEISFKDVLGNTIPYDETNFSDITLSNASSWDNEDEWGMKNLFDNDLEYTDTASGPTSSTMFNLGMENYMDESEFHISLTQEQMEVLDTIEISAGSPDGRVPQSIAVYAVFDKDIPETKRETLIFLRTFTAEIDGRRPSYSTRATQTVNPADPCNTLFENGMNEDGNYLVMNPGTGLLELIFCNFPTSFLASETDNDTLCKEDPRSLVIVEGDDGHLFDMSISAYFKKNGWICEFGGCEGLSASNYASCIKEACEAKERNEATIVKYLDNNFNLVQMNITDYLASKNVICENLIPVINEESTFPDNFEKEEISNEAYKEAVENGFVGTFEEWLQSLYDAWLNSIDTINPMSFSDWRAAQDQADREYRASLSNLDSLIEQTGYGTDGVITMINPATGVKTQVTASEYKQLIAAPIPKPIISTLNIDNVYVASGEEGSFAPETEIELEIDNVVNMDINNIKVIDTLGAIRWHFKEEVIMVPVFNAFGSPIVDENGFQVEEPKNVIKIVIDKINMPEGMDYGITEITITDGTTSQTIHLAIREDGLTISEYQYTPTKYNKPLEHIEARDYRRKLEWDDAGVAIKYFGSKGLMRVENISDKFEVSITPDGRGGMIVIKSVFNVNDITGLYKENVIITDGVRTYNLELYVTSHMRIGEMNFFEDTLDLGTLNFEDNSCTVPLLNADINPKVLKIWDKRAYTSNGYDDTPRDVNEYYGSYARIITNPDSIDETDKFLIKFYFQTQNLTGAEYFIIDPFFNQKSFNNNLIDKDDIQITELNFKIDKKMTISKSNIRIDKFRYYNSKNDFNHEYKCWNSDFTIFNQAPGLNVEIENPEILGVAYGENCNFEYYYWSRQQGGAVPIKFRLLTEQRFTEIGSTSLRFYDIDSEININVEVIQSLDIVLGWNRLERRYDIPVSIIGDNYDIQLLHPWDNDWSRVRAWSNDESIASTNIVDGVLTVSFHSLGETDIYVTDGYATHKMVAIPVYGEQFTPAFTRLDIIDTDSNWYEIDLINVHGNVTVGDFNNDIVELEILANDKIRFRNTYGIGNFDVSTTIPFTDTAEDGIVTTNLKINILDHNKWFVSNYVTQDYQPGTVISVTSLPGNWTVTGTPKGVEAWITSKGDLKVRTNISGTHTIELTHTDGTVKYVNIYVSPLWSMDNTPIIFNNNNYIADGE